MYSEVLPGLLLSTLCPFIPFILGLFRIRRMDPAYFPFVVVLGCATLAESVRFIQLSNYYAEWGMGIGLTPIPYNIYVLAIGLSYTLLFFNWGLYRGNKKLLTITLVLLALVWGVDHFLVPGHSIHGFTRWYRLLYSTLICLFSIHHINKLIVTERNTLLKNSSFLICVGILLFFMVYIVNEGILLFDLKTTRQFLESINMVRKGLNFVVYLVIFTLAVLWIPPKKPFIQLS
ncbi:MAG TPA: hypothetical protein VK907_08990 [Phnomibacter sp.]|nr:hypothetical protein [Phnomibacter sp.]